MPEVDAKTPDETTPPIQSNGRDPDADTDRPRSTFRIGDHEIDLFDCLPMSTRTAAAFHKRGVRADVGSKDFNLGDPEMMAEFVGAIVRAGYRDVSKTAFLDMPFRKLNEIGIAIARIEEWINAQDSDEGPHSLPPTISTSSTSSARSTTGARRRPSRSHGKT